MREKKKILIVEDEAAILHFLSAILAANGYAVLHAVHGAEGLSMAASHLPDLVLLDLGLPDMDGVAVLESIREWSDMPVIVVSARQDETEKVQLLDAGANDYVTKPFGNNELLARIRTALRQRARLGAGATPQGSRFVLDGLRIDYEKRRVYVGERLVHFTPIEYKILLLLSQNAGKVLTHDYMIREVWGPYASDSQVLRVNMANIRRKIEENPADPRYILTEVGVGYRMADVEGLSARSG